MCIALYTANKSQSVDIDFVYERLYHQRNGDRRLVLDFLVQNTGKTPIGQLRVIYPDPTVDVSPVYQMEEKEEVRARRLINRAWKRQLRNVEVHTDQLSIPEHSENW